MEALKKVSQQTIWQLLGKAATSFSTLLILSLISRNFGEATTGVFTLALTYLAFFTTAVDFGVNAHLLPSFLKEDFSDDLRKLLGFRLILATFLTILASIIIIFWPQKEGLFQLIALLGLFSIFEFAVFITASAIFQSKHRYDLAALATSVGSLTNLAIIYLVIQFGLPVPYLMLGYVSGWMISGVLAALFIKKYSKNLFPIFDLSFIRKTISEVWPFSATLLLNIVYFRVDAFILSFNKTFTDVGVYNLAFQIFQAALVLPIFIMNGFYPMMLKKFNESRKKFVVIFYKACLLMFALSLLGTAFTLVLSPLVITLIVGGKGFAGSAQVLQILSFGFPAFFLTALLMWALIVFKKYQTLLIIYLAGLAFNTVLNLILIPIFSYFGAAWVTVASEYFILLLQAVALLLVFRKG